MQFAANAVFLCIHLAQPFQVAARAENDENQNRQTCQYQQQQRQPYRAQLSENLLVVQHADKHPVGLATHRVVEHMQLLAPLVHHRLIALLVIVSLQQFQNELVHGIVLACQQMTLSGHQETPGRPIGPGFFHHLL